MNRRERRRRTENIYNRRLRQAREVEVICRPVWHADPSRIMSLKWPKQPGRGRSMSHFDCGNTRCGTCHWEKLDTKTSRERIERQAAKQGAEKP